MPPLLEDQPYTVDFLCTAGGNLFKQSFLGERIIDLEKTYLVVKLLSQNKEHGCF